MPRGVWRVGRWFVVGLVALGLCEALLAGVARLVAKSRGEAVGAGQSGGIFCLGDSYTFGIGAPDGRSYPDQLRARLAEAGDARTVANLGVAGFPTSRMVEKLATSLEKATPAWVLFAGGANDFYRGDLFLEMKRAGGAPGPARPDRGRVLPLLRTLRTFRLFEAFALRVAGAERTERFGGAVADPWPRPEEIPPERWASAYEEAAAAGPEPLFRWLAHYWQLEYPAEATRAFDRFVASMGEANVAADLRVSIDLYRWELAMLRGEVAGRPIPSAGRVGIDLVYAEFTRAYCLLLDGKGSEARTILDALLAAERDPLFAGYFRVHRAWIPLLERDFEGADAELSGGLPVLAELSPRIGFFQALAAGAIARLLRDESTRLAEWTAGPGALWKELYWWPQSPFSHEWMVAAEWIDALKRGDATAVAIARDQAAKRFGPTPATRLLAYLYEHPDAGFAELRASLPIDPPRAAYFGARRMIWREFRSEEMDRLVGPSFERLADLSRRHGFRVLVLTYLNYEATVPNDRLRRLAREQGWPLVDMEAFYSRDELGADGKTRYFSPDRGHPNEAGYDLVARAAFRKLKEIEGRR